MKLVFIHEKESILEALGFTEEQIAKAADIAYTHGVQPSLDTMREHLPAILKSNHPMKDQEGFNDEMDKIMPSYTEIAEKLQDAWLEAGFEPDMKLGYMMGHTVDKVTNALQSAMHQEIAMSALKDLGDKVKAKPEEN